MVQKAMCPIRLFLAPLLNEAIHVIHCIEKLAIREFRPAFPVPRQVDVSVSVSFDKVKEKVIIAWNPSDDLKFFAVQRMARICFDLPTQFAEEVVFFLG